MSDNIPAWARDPFLSFVDDIEQIGGSMLIISSGFSILSEDPSIIRNRYLPESPTIQDIHVHNIIANMLSDGRSLNNITKQFVVSLWSSLEIFISDFLIQWIKNIPSSTQDEEIGKIRIALADYMLMSDEDRRVYLIDSLKQNLKSSLKQGLGAFEPLLDRFDLGGPVDKNIKDKIYELSNVRNIVVHRRGIVDQRFAKNLPDLHAQVGTTFIVSPEMFGAYTHAVQQYITTIFTRVGKYFDAQ